LRAAYAAAVPEFDKFMLVMPSLATSTSEGATRSLGFSIRYQAPIANMWNFVTPNLGTAPLIRMDSVKPDGEVLFNPNWDARFAVMARVDRTTGFSGATPHSSTFGSLSGALLTAARGVFNPGSSTSTLEINNTSIVGTICNPAGFRIFQDGDNFWFRSKADPTDWFKVERQ